MIDPKFIASFIIGGAIGSFVTYLMIKNKYDKEKQDEISEIRNLYLVDKLERAPLVDDEETTHTLDTNSESEVKKILHHYNEEDNSDFSEYVDEASKYNPNDVRPTTKDIEQITEDEFGEEFDYDCVTLYYYLDGVLADQSDNIIDNEATLLIPNYTLRLEESDSDVIFIRNHRLKTDFEILRITDKSYSDLLEENPYISGD